MEERVRSAWAHHWGIDPGVDFLNHGSFGACPKVVLERQSELRAEMERELIEFFVRKLEGQLDDARTALGGVVRAEPEDLAFVPNATYAVNSVVRSLRFRPGDELLTTDHAYNACCNVLRYVAERDGASVRVVTLPFPIQDPGAVTQAIVDGVTPNTRLLLLDHITSPTGLVLPARQICHEMATRGVDTLVDGAHCVGHIDLDIPSIGATWYTSNCHKWLCAPKGSAFLWTRRDRQVDVRPACISHAANATRSDRSRYLQEFDWVGTDDPTPYLCIPDSIRFMDELMPGGLAAVREHNHALALEGRDILCEALDRRPPAPDSMIGCLAAVQLPDGQAPPPDSAFYTDPLQDELFARGIEVPIVPFPGQGRRLVRISAQAYNHRDQYERLARSLVELL